MSSRRTAAARPKRSGETFARTHDSTTTGNRGKPRFDPRNPSALAPDARDEDDDDNEDLLAADVVGRSATIKRGAVNIDGFDSDSDNDNINAQADARAKRRRKQNRAGDFERQMDKYDAGDGGEDEEEGDRSDIDMFAEEKDEGGEEGGEDDGADAKKKAVRFLEADEIADQEANSRDRTRISINPHDRRGDDDSSDSDSEDARLAAQEGSVDAEVGAGGLKRGAPKIEAFNLRQEMDEGRFDQDGNYVRKAADPDAQHDSWLAGVSRRDIRRAAEAHERRRAEADQRRLDEAGVSVGELLGGLIARLERGETALEALARLGKRQRPRRQRQKKVPAWKLKKQQEKEMERNGSNNNGGAGGDHGDGGMEVDTISSSRAEKEEEEEDLAQKRIRADIEAITDAADKLLAREHDDIYDQERELLQRAYRRETGHDWVEPARSADGGAVAAAEAEEETRIMWEYRWTDGRGDGAKQGPFDESTMKAWQDAGYFGGGGVEFRPVGDDGGWTLLPSF